MIPSWPLGRATIVTVDSAVGGILRIIAGGSPEELTTISAGRTKLSRQFGGVPFLVDNRTNKYMIVWT